MIQNNKPLYMHRLHFDSDKVLKFLKARSLLKVTNGMDLDYGFHSIIKELFGNLAPQPFFLRGFFATGCELLGYGEHDLYALKGHASAFADPSVHQLVIWEGCAEKKMPDVFPNGHRLGFEVRICPIKRSRNTNVLDNKPQGILREYDAYLSRQDKSLTRNQVYSQWITRILEERGGVQVLETNLERFCQKQHSMQRRGQDRVLETLGSRPDATMSGTIQIVDGSVFNEALRNGVGRHKAFGFGMLLLKPVT